MHQDSSNNLRLIKDITNGKLIQIILTLGHFFSYFNQVSGKWKGWRKWKDNTSNRFTPRWGKLAWACGLREIHRTATTVVCLPASLGLMMKKASSTGSHGSQHQLSEGLNLGWIEWKYSQPLLCSIPALVA